MKFSRHGEQRFRQRGKRQGDLSLVLRYGTETSDGYFLRDRDIESAIRDLKMKIGRLEHLRGFYVVTDKERSKIVTAYYPDREKQRQVLEPAS